MLVYKLDIYRLEVLVPVHSLLRISAYMEAADCIVAEILDDLLLLGAEVADNA
jgi:hypothetical protein